MQLRILGPLEVADGDGPRPLGGPKQRTVLAHLVIRANQAIDSDRLIGEVWGDEPPPAARSTLRGYLSHLRKALGPDQLEHRSGGYVLRAEPSAIDAVRFEALVHEGRAIRTADPATAVQIFQQALGLWRGPALADLTDQASLQPEIARLEELRLAALEGRIDAELELARHRELVPELETLVAAHPFRERLWLHLMTALYRSDRQADALAAFQRARELLAEELGIDPSPELRRLHERILRQDPSLDIPGEPLRGYRLLEQVGAGSFGSVHRAFQPQVGREVAIKTIHPRFANDPEFIRRFEAEAQLVARLEHPHVVPLYDFWREPDGAYLVMRYLRGGSLRERLAHGPLGSEEAARLLDQMAQALVVAHRQGVVHRDVKPANILFDEEGNAYLSDFGIAKDVEVAEVAPGRTPSPLAYYLSPEEIRGEPATSRTDIYSLGLVLYEILAGRHPFADAAPDEVMAKHLTEPVPSIREFRPELPSAVDEVIAKATAKAPAERYPDAQVIASAFRASLVPAAPRPAIPSTEVRNPYKGLRPFLESDAADFFGREALVRELVARLSQQDASRFLAVVGPSGSGKSSLVRAGLMPALRGGAVPGSDRWFLLEMRPGTHPFEELASALIRIAVHPPSDLVERLERGDLGLVSVAEEMLPPGSDLLLVIDQFEELFTLVDDVDVRERFLGIVLPAATEPTSRVRIVCTLRADFYDRPLAYAGLAELMKSRTVTVTPLVPEELQRAVVGPAEGVGLRIDPALVAEIVADVATQPGALPLLQYALTELFDQREGSTLTLDGYRRIGGVSGALSRRAEALYRRLTRSGQEATRQLFLRLITVGREGGGDTRRRVLRSELTSLEVDVEALDAMIDTFGARRLLSLDRDPATRGPTVEVAHEALLTEWGRLRGWIEAAREDVRTHRRLAAGARDWSVSGRDPSFVLRGTHLARFEAWAASSGLALTADEHDYLEAGLAQRDADRAEAESRKAREAALERRSARRLRGLVAVFAVAALIAATLTVVATDQRGRAQREARIATARELAAAAVANLEVDPELGVLLAIQAVQATRSVDGTILREAEEALHRAVVASRLELEVPGLGGLLAWSPKGVFVTEGPEDSGLIDIRDGETGQSVLSFQGHDGDVNDVAFSPDGSRLASTGGDGALNVWDPSTGRLLSSLSANGEAWGPSFSADGSLVSAAWSHDEGGVLILDLSTDRVVSTIRVPPGGAIDTALSPDGQHVAMARPLPGDEVGAVFDVTTGEQAFALAGPSSGSPVDSRGVAWSPDGRLIAASSEGTARVWDAETGTVRHTLLGHSGLVLGVAWSPDSSRLVTGGSDGTAKVWEIGPEGVLERWSLSAQESKSGIVGVAFSPDGSRVMAGDAGISAVKVWDLGPTGDAEWANLPAPGYPGAEFMPDGRRVVTSSWEGRVEFPGVDAVTIWDLRTGRESRTIGPPTDYFWFGSFDVSPDGSSIALGGGSTPEGFGGASAVRAWDTSTGEELWRIGHDPQVNEVAFSPDGEYVATADWQGTTKIVDRSGRVIRVLSEGDHNFSDVAFSSDGRLVATAAFNGSADRVRVWEWARGQVLLTIDAEGPYAQVDFDPDGPRVLLTGSDGLAEIWDVETGARVAVLAGPPGGVKDLVFSPDGSRIAIASVDGLVRLFDADTGAQQLSLRGSGCAVEGVAFSPDGMKLASTSWCDGVRIWALDIDDLLQIARREAGRAITVGECRQYLHVDQCPRA
jgi:WD40 repeat protein/serine/threonine protein kinase/DNA-binding SARP family transcriptional activator